MTQASQGRRRGAVFSVRVSDEERAKLDALQAAGGGPRALGPWLVWRAMAAGNARARARGTAKTPEKQAFGSTGSSPVPVEKRVILDLCGGSGSWSVPYAAAGYQVIVVDPVHDGSDVRTFAPPARVWGVLAAPPCTEFSIARNGHPDQPRDFVGGMATVNACMRVALQCRPRWWALENPTGHLAKFLGRPRDTFEPCDFGDPWTKRTSLWGEFAIPERGPFVIPTGSAMARPTAALRAVTPPGFAAAFFRANP